MSATGRTKGLRVESDDYATPPWCVDRILEALFNRPSTPEAIKPQGKPAYWLDPCAGEGGLIRAADKWLGMTAEQGYHANVRWHACEIRPECEEPLKQVANPVIIGDFLSVVPARYDLILTNPPYKLAEEFVRACVPVATMTVMLLRLNWLENRASLLRQHPADICVLPNRPTFGLNKKNKVGADATAYAWYVWAPDSMGRISFLEQTPRLVRSAYRRELEARLLARRKLLEPAD